MHAAVLPVVRPRRHGLALQMLALLAMLVGLAMALLYGAATQRIEQVAESSSRAWSASMAQAAARAGADHLAAADFGSLENVLRDMAELPGVLRIDIVDAADAPLMTLRADGQGHLLGVWKLSDPAGPDGPSPDAAARDVLQSWAPVGAGGVHGRIGVSFLLGRDRAHFERLREDAVVAIALTGALLVVAAFVLVHHSLRPLRRLVRFARRLGDRPGETIDEPGDSLEILQLTQALNDASRTLRKQLDAARASEVRLGTIVDAAPDAILGFGPDGRIAIASPAAASTFGYEPQDLVGLPVEHLVPELAGDVAETRTLAGTFMRSSGTHVTRWEVQAQRHGGTAFPVEVSLARVMTEDGPRYAAVMRDITERQMSEQMLNLYGRALECTRNGIVISDVDAPGQPVFYANAAFTAITGYGAGEAIGRNCAFLQRGDDAQPEIEALREAVRARRSAQVVLRNYRKDGSLFFNELSIAPVPAANGEVRHYVGVLNDVTDRERSRLAIAERSARLNAVFDLSPDGFVVFDREGQLVYTNRSFLTMTGWSDTVALQGMSLQEFDERMSALRDASLPYPPLSMQGAEDGGFETMDLLQLALPRFRVLTRLVRHNAGGQGESILYFRDVTHETEVDRMKSEFLTTAAHELRTPMVSVYGFTELLLNRPVPEARRRDVLQTIHRQASLLINMVNELLDLARIEARQGRVLSMDICRTGELLRQAVDAIGGTAAGTHSVMLDPASVDAALQGDGEKLLRALTNVLSNAVKYSPQGGRIDVSCVEGTIDGRDAIGLKVTDAGLGMSPEQVARVFERFYRADPSGNIPGTGLGMCLVKEIVDLHDGRIDLQSQLGVGTCVTLWLPRMPEAALID